MKLNKKQKRTATIASMAALLAVVLGMGGSTFAKYIETHTVTTQQATVAKWGVVATSNITNFFGASYEGNVIAAAQKGNDIVATASGNVVAPGSSGSMTFTVTGQPQVASRITIAAEGQDVVLNYSDNGTNKVYRPIMWTLSGGNLEQAVTCNALEDMIESIEDLSGDYAAETVLDQTYTLSWAWAFENNPAENYSDYRDAALGNFATQATDKDPDTTDNEIYTSAETTVSFGLTITVTQIQDYVAPVQP